MLQCREEGEWAVPGSKACGHQVLCGADSPGVAIGADELDKVREHEL